MENNDLNWLEKPVLNKPGMIIAFSGWTNAGEVPSSVMWYILSRLESTLFAELETDPYYVYGGEDSESSRPSVNIENGMVQSYTPATLNFWSYKAPSGGHDLILISGPEPEQNWNQLVEVILELAREFEVPKITILGGTFDAIPHTAPTRITGAANFAAEIDELKERDIEPVNYKGPTGVHSLIMVNAARQNIPVVSLWTHTPHYIQVVDFISCYHLMLKLNKLLDLRIELETAKKDSEYLYQQINQAIEKKPELVEYLKTLEAEFQQGKTERQEPINQTIIKEIEDLFSDNQS